MFKTLLSAQRSPTNTSVCQRSHNALLVLYQGPQTLTKVTLNIINVVTAPLETKHNFIYTRKDHAGIIFSTVKYTMLNGPAYIKSLYLFTIKTCIYIHKAAIMLG